MSAGRTGLVRDWLAAYLALGETMTIQSNITWDLVGRGCWDAVVIGAGPAGAVAARQLALLGGRVLLVDRKTFPRKKVCGGCLSQRAVENLTVIGLGRVLNGLKSQRLSEFCLSSKAGTLRLPLPGGLAVSRAEFDAALVREAIGAGAHFCPEAGAMVGPCESECRSINLHRVGGEVSSTVKLRARVVIAADGLGHPCLGSLREFSQKPGKHSRLGAACEMLNREGDIAQGVIHMAVSRHGYVGMVVVEPGHLNIAAAFDPSFVRNQGGLGNAAAAVLRDTKTPAITGLEQQAWQGTPALTRKPSRLAAERIFVIGDAAGYIEPFTGEGIAWALTTGREVAPLAQSGWQAWDSRFEAAWRQTYARRVGRRQWLCRLLAQLLRSEACVSVGIAALGHLPWLTNKVVDWVQAPITKPSWETAVLAAAANDV